MTTERIEIIVTERGTREVNRRLRNIGGTAAASASGVNILRSALALLGGAAIIRGLARTADSFTLIRNRLGFVTESVTELNMVQEELFEISNRTRGSFRASAEIYARLGLASKTLGTSQSDLLAITETLNKAVTLSGATAAEGTAALIQLSQAFASNRLSGDEFRSVAEQLPVVLRLIADELGVGIGKARELGQAGKITADVITAAILNGQDEINKAFADTNATIDQSLNVLGNAFLKFVGELDQSTNASKILSTVILTLAKNFEVFGKSVVVVSTVLGIGFGKIAIGQAIAGLRALKVALAATGIGAIPIILATAITSLVVFSDKIRIVRNETVTLADLGKAAFEELKIAVLDVFESFKPALAIVRTFLQRFVEDFDFTFLGALRTIATFVDNGLAALKAFTATGKVIFDNLGILIETALVDTLEGVINTAIADLNKLIKLFNELSLSVARLTKTEAFVIQPLKDIDLNPDEGLKDKIKDLAGFFTATFAAEVAKGGSAQEILDRVILRAEIEKLNREAEADLEAARARSSGPSAPTDIAQREINRVVNPFADLNEDQSIGAVE